MAADLAAFDLDRPAYAGAAEHDPLAALVFCAPQPAALTVVGGRVVVRDGRLATIDERSVLARHRAFARALGAPGGSPGSRA
jgi:cytosine/adenosine deaminase-related metal-dependent hydrolase